MASNEQYQKEARAMREQKRISIELEESGGSSFNPMNVLSQEGASWASNEATQNSKRKSQKLDEDGRAKLVSKGHS